jgi:gag-polyprotein putative aspartyl protease
MNPELLQGDSIRYVEKLYIAVSLKIVVMIANKFLLALIDSGAEVIVMSRSLAKNLGLPISKNVVMKMLTSEGRESRFTGLCSDIEIAIGDVKYRIPIWIVEKLKQNLILGRIYAKAARLSVKDEDDGICVCTVYSMDRSQEVSFLACQADEEENRTRKQLVLAEALNALAEV